MTSQDQIDKIISLYSEGISFRKISRATGISKTTCHRIIKRLEDETKNYEEVYENEEFDNTVPSTDFEEADSGFPWLIVVMGIAGLAFIGLIIWWVSSGKGNNSG